MKEPQEVKDKNKKISQIVAELKGIITFVAFIIGMDTENNLKHLNPWREAVHCRTLRVFNL